jgi:hypothetical protein
MARKLKTYQTALGFFDQAIAAPSMKAALEAWGADSNLFHQGAAKESDDPDVIAAAMAKPGVVLRRPVGSDGPFSEHAELPTNLGDNEPTKAARKPKSLKPKNTSARPIDKAAERKAALAYKREQVRREREQAREEAARQKERERREHAIDKARRLIRLRPSMRSEPRQSKSRSTRSRKKHGLTKPTEIRKGGDWKLRCGARGTEGNARQHVALKTKFRTISAAWNRIQQMARECLSDNRANQQTVGNDPSYRWFT